MNAHVKSCVGASWFFILLFPEYARNHIYFSRRPCALYFSNHVIVGFCFINLEIQYWLVTLASFIAKLLLGNVLKDGTPIAVNPLVIWAWAGLLINAINSIPAGELDGGRIAFAIWGRKVCHLKLNIFLKWNLKSWTWLCYHWKSTFTWLISWSKTLVISKYRKWKIAKLIKKFHLPGFISLHSCLNRATWIILTI